MATSSSTKSPSDSPREKVRATVPKLIDLTEKVLFGDVWERPGCPSAIAALSPSRR